LNSRTTPKQRGKIRRHIYITEEDQTDTYIYYKIEQQASTKAKGEDQTDIYIYTIRLNSRTTPKQRGRIRRTHIYILKRKIRRTHTYTIRLNNRPPLKQRGKIRRTHIYYKIEQQASTKTKGEDQTDIYIYYKIEQQDYTKKKGEDQTTHIYTKEEDQTDTYIYYKIEQQASTKTKGKDQTDTYIK
jgi:hypothetical protein